MASRLSHYGRGNSFHSVNFTAHKNASAAALIFSFLYTCLFHVYMILHIPDPIFESDSTGYLQGTLSYLNGGRFSIPLSRGLGYPLLLWLNLRWTGFHGLLWVQHGLWIAAAIATCALFLAHQPHRYAWAAILLFIVACSPRAAVLAHTALSDSSYAVWQMMFCYFLLANPTRTATGNGLLGGIFGAFAINTRPVGKSIILPIIAMASSRHVESRLRKQAIWATVGLVIASAPFLIYNRKDRGFWGFEKFGDFYLAANAIQHLTPEEITNPDVQRLLTPFYRPELASQFQDLNWIWHNPAGPIAALQKDPGTTQRLPSIYHALIFRAVSKHPLRYARDLLHTAAKFILRGTERQGSVPTKALTIQRGLLTFYGFTNEFPSARQLLMFRPYDAQRYFTTLSQTDVAPFDQGPWFLMPIWYLSKIFILLSPGGILALIWLCMRSWEIPLVQASFYLIVGQILMIVAGGTFVYRYAIPLEPLYALLIIFALSQLRLGLRNNPLKFGQSSKVTGRPGE